MKKKKLRFYCSLFTGQGRNRRVRYCQSVDWVDDQIVLTFSDHPCSISYDAVLAFEYALDSVENAPFRRFKFSYFRDEDSVKESDFFCMANAVRSFLDQYGCEAFNDLVNDFIVPGGDS